MYDDNLQLGARGDQIVHDLLGLWNDWSNDVPPSELRPVPHHGARRREARNANGYTAPIHDDHIPKGTPGVDLVGVNVRRQHGERRTAHDCGKRIETEVEVVVAHGKRVIPQHVHGVDHRMAAQCGLGGKVGRKGIAL